MPSYFLNYRGLSDQFLHARMEEIEIQAETNGGMSEEQKKRMSVLENQLSSGIQKRFLANYKRFYRRVKNEEKDNELQASTLGECKYSQETIAVQKRFLARLRVKLLEMCVPESELPVP